VSEILAVKLIAYK